MPTKAKKKSMEKASKKNLEKKKKSAIEDKTFGLKNKNKSAKVQAFTKGVERGIMNSGNDAQFRKQEQDKKNLKEARKNFKKEKKAEEALLFDEALKAASRKGPKFGNKDGKVEAKGRDHGAEEKKGGTSRAMKMMFQMDAKEMEDKLKEDPNYVPTLEDKVEAQRQKKLKDLKDSGVKGTPITEASFKIWQDKKRKRKEAAVKKMVETEMRKKKGGKGLSVLSGRELYNYKKALFKDQEGASDNIVSGMDEDMDEDAGEGVEAVAEKVEKDLFLDGDDDDLDDLDDLDEE